MNRRTFLLAGTSIAALSACQSSLEAADTTAAQLEAVEPVQIAPKMSQALSHAGLNLYGDWSLPESRNYPGNLDREVGTSLADGFRHITFITRCDEFFNFSCSNAVDCVNFDAIDRRIKPILQQIRVFSRRFPDRVFVISLKGYNQIGGWDAPGIKQSYFARALEENDYMRIGFIKSWQYIAQLAQDIPTETLAFNLMNEPEWHSYSNDISHGRNKWAEISTNCVDAIRNVTQDRVVIIEAVDKGTWYRHENTPSRIHKVIPRDGIFYGFHYYGPKQGDWTHQRNGGGLPLTIQMKSAIKSDINTLLRWKKTQNVPVILSEIGCWGPYYRNGTLENGATADDRAEWANLITDLTFAAGVGITWWALNARNTPYQLTVDPNSSPHLPMVRDKLLWDALKLQ